MGGFKRYIAIFYNDKAWASKIFDELVELMKREIFDSFRVGNESNDEEIFVNNDREKNSIDKITKSRFAMEIMLKNGSVIKILPADDFSKQKGLSFHEVYIQKGTSYKIYKQITQNLSSVGDGIAYFMTENLNDFYFRISADRYYKENKRRNDYGKKQSKQKKEKLFDCKKEKETRSGNL